MITLMTVLLVAGGLWVAFKFLHLVGDALGFVIKLILGLIGGLFVFALLVALASVVGPVIAIIIAVVGGLLIPND